MTETASSSTHGEGQAGDGETRRDFLYLATGAVAGVGVASFAWPFISSMAPSRDVLALATTTVDLSSIEVGQSITIEWQKKPVFIRRRTEAEIAEAKAVDMAQLIDKEADEARAARPEWLVVLGVCTHLGCIPLGNKQGDNRGEFGGWFCPCHGSHYDTSGRIRKGPAPKNLPVPPLEYLDDNTIRIG